MTDTTGKPVLSTVEGNDTLRIGIIGTGFGRMHLLGYRQCANVQVTAICQRTKEKAEAFAREYGIPHLFTDYRDLIAHPEVDVVSIAAPPYVHHEMALAALAAGKPVLCEKPFVMNLQQAREMYNCAQASGLTHMTAFNWRFIPAVQRLKELVDEGYLGRIYHVDASWFAERQVDPNLPLLWRHRKELAGVGVLGDIAPHIIDMLRWLLGDFRKVCAHTLIAIKERRLPGSDQTVMTDAEDACAFLAETSSGAQVSVHVSRVARMSNRQHFELYGSNGVLLYDVDRKDNSWIVGRLQGARVGDKALSPLPIPERLREGLDLSDPDAAVGSFLFAQLTKRFVNSIRGHRQESPSFLEGMKSQEVIDALVQSASTERWVPLPLPV